MVSRQGFIGKVRFPVKISNAVFQLACGSAAPSVFLPAFFCVAGWDLAPAGRNPEMLSFLECACRIFQTDRGFDPVWRALVKNMAAVFLSFDVGNPPFVAGTLLWRIG